MRSLVKRFFIRSILLSKNFGGIHPQHTHFKRSAAALFTLEP